MLSTRFLRVLIVPAVLSLTSCSVQRNLTRQSRSSQEIKALAAEVGSLERSVTSLRTEIRQLTLDVSRRTSASETLRVERVTEVYDTDKPVDPALGTPPVKSRTTERSDAHTSVTVDESSSLTSDERVESRDSSQTEADIRRTEAVDSRTEERESVSQETASGHKEATWGQKTLMYAGIAAIVYVVLKLVLGRKGALLKGILSMIKQLFKTQSQ